MQSILVLSPHPDDLEISSGILSLVAKKKGYELNQIIMTDGRNGGINKSLFGSEKLVQRRRTEAIKASKILGVKSNLFLNFEDGKLNKYFEEATFAVEEEIKKILPTILVSPSEFDNHPDHFSTAEIIKDICKIKPNIIIIYYSFWGDGKNNTVLLGKEFQQTKIKAIQTYKSQPYRNYIQMLSKRGMLSEEYFYIPSNIQESIEIFSPYLKYSAIKGI